MGRQTPAPWDPLSISEPSGLKFLLGCGSRAGCELPRAQVGMEGVARGLVSPPHPHHSAPSAAYQVSHRLNTSAVTAAAVEVLEASARQFTATGLQPEATYLFRVTAQTRKGWGEAAEALVVTTEKRGNHGGGPAGGGGLAVPPQCSQPLAFSVFIVLHTDIHFLFLRHDTTSA